MTSGAVLFVHPSDEAYGADRVLLQMAVGLRSRGWRIRVLLSDDQPPGWLTSRLTEESIAVARGPLAPGRRRYLRMRGLVGYIRLLHRARAWIRSEASTFKPDVIHVNTSALLVGAAIGRPGGARVIWHVHELVVRPRIASWVFRVVPTLTASHVIAISRAVRDHVTPRGLGRMKVSTVWNGIESRPVVPPNVVDPPVVAFVGRLNRWKGLEVFLAAIPRVATAFSEVRFLIAGDPPAGEEWRTQTLDEAVGRLGLGNRVEILGFEGDVPGLLDRVSVLVVPSIWPEPFGLVTLEGMGAGRAVVATAHGGALDLIEPEQSGLLVAPGDPGALGDAIERLLADPALRERLGESAHRRAQTMFSEGAFLDAVERVYRRSLGQVRRGDQP
jgi:glycosyltransferase involved in cell wall biosynthesis